MNTLILAISLMLSTSVYASRSACVDKNLINLNWSVERGANLEGASSKLLELVHKNPKQYVDKKSFKMYSSIARRWVELVTIDFLPTPHDEMFGDILWIHDLETKELAEIRWYKDGQVYVKYNSEYQICATNLVPFVDNSLY